MKKRGLGVNERVGDRFATCGYAMSRGGIGFADLDDTIIAMFVTTRGGRMAAPVENSADKTAEVLRSMLNHESDVIHHRMSWLGTFQGFLFAGLGFSWNLHENVPIIVICVLGISISLVVLASLIASSLATQHLLVWWQTNKPKDYRGPDVIGLPRKDPKSWRYLLAPWNLLPVIFAIAWLSLFVIRLIYYFP